MVSFVTELFTRTETFYAASAFLLEKKRRSLLTRPEVYTFKLHDFVLFWLQVITLFHLPDVFGARIVQSQLVEQQSQNKAGYVLISNLGI